MKKFTLFFLFSITILGCFAQGEVVNYSIMQGDSLRTYILYVPSSYDGTEDWPLVISLHGYTHTSEIQMIYTNMNAVADTGNFLVAYPQALLMSSNLPGLPPQGPGWNSSEEGDPLYSSPGNTDDVGFIRQVITKIESDYKIAQDQIYATGFSAGGFMCYVLACELDDKIAAIASVSGTPRFGRACSPNRSVPVMHIHGTEDPNIHYEGVPPLAISVEETIEFWLEQNGCNEEPVITQFPDVNTEDSTTVEMYQWNNCDAEFVHLKVIGGGHQWPGGVDLLPSQFGRMNKDINASAEIWKFFKNNKNTSTFPTTTTDNNGIDNRSAYFTVYPNPAVDNITIGLDALDATSANLQLVNSLGQVVATTNREILNMGHQELKWHLKNNHLPNGLYYLVIKLDSEQLLSKSISLVKN